MKLDWFYNKCFLKNISTKFTINNQDAKQINSLDETISYLHTNYKYLKDKYRIFQESKININQNNVSPILNKILGKNQLKYAELSQEMEDFIGIIIFSKNQWNEVNKKFQTTIQFIQDYIEKISLLKYIYSQVKDIETNNKTDYPFCNFSGLEKYISNKTLAIKFQFKLNANKGNDSQLEQIQSVMTELSEIKTNVSKLLSLDENPEKVKETVTKVTHLMDILGLNTIYQINLNENCEILINIDNKDYQVKDIISECKKIEEQTTNALNQAEKFYLLINNCFENNDFIVTYQESCKSKKRTSINTLNKKTNQLFKNIDFRLSLKIVNELCLSMKVIENNTNFKYLQSLHEQIGIFLQYNKENKDLDVNKIIALIQILGLSMEGIGLNSSSQYVLYSNYDKSKFITLEDAIQKLSNLKDKIQVYISRTKSLLAIGQRCLEYPQLFITLSQSYLTSPENVKSYLTEYKTKLEQAKVNSETRVTEVEEKISTVKSIYSELTEAQKYVKYVFDLVYTLNKAEATITAKNESKPADNISELFQSVHELALVCSNIKRKQIMLIFISGDTKQNYLTHLDKFKILNNSLCDLKIEAEKIKNKNEKLLQQKIEQITQQRNRSLENRAFKSLCIKLLVISVFVWVLSWAFILYKSNSDENVNSEATTTY